MDPVAGMKATAETMRALLAGIDDGQLGLPTPCAEWSVADLADHVIANPLNSFAHWVGVDREHVPASSAAELATRYGQAVETLLDAYTAPGVLENTRSTPLGEFPGEALLAVCFADQLTHVWDLARATGQPVDVPDQLAEDAIAVWAAFIQEPLRNGSTFGTEVAAAGGASALDRLAAFTGRTV